MHKSMRKILLLSLALFLLLIQSHAQSVSGFWVVNKVSVGDRSMTPVAKWFKNNKDGTFQSGNGWTQNSVGTWTYDKETKEFIPTNTNGLKDEYGPFQVSFSGDNMIWERQEDGMKVVVTLSEINEMPIAPADQIVGLWSLSNVKKMEEDASTGVDPDGNPYLFIRPDRLYRIRNADATFDNGYWHMDGHNPEFHLINHNREKAVQIFTISFRGNQLFMKQKEGDQLELRYNRINEFP
jgi:hypothetical protein